ncbi:MAG: transketolase, partial [Elusimicrobia bacterium RIFCSPLOWO2_01_FULL_54_10]
VVLSADIGFKLFDRYKASYADRFFNCGIAEANMISMAAGMALSGLRPFTYTIVPFMLSRSFEQIRLDVCYHNLPVTIVGVGSGFSYSSLNASHHSCEDIALMRMLPNMTILCPCDPLEVRLALRAAARHSGPVYIRIGKKGETAIHSQEFDFAIGKALTMRQGKDVCMLSTGALLSEVLKAADLLEKSRISSHVVHFHTLKPLDEGRLLEIFSQFDHVVTVEEHYRSGGLGGGVAEWMADHPNPKTRLHRIGVPDAFFNDTGNQKYAREFYGLDSEGIARQTLSALGRS